MKALSLILSFQLITSPVLADDYIWNQTSRNDNPLLLVNVFEEYVDLYGVQKSGESASDNLSEALQGLSSESGAVLDLDAAVEAMDPIKQVLSDEELDIAAEEMAYLHWNKAADRRQYNEILLAALSVYNASAKARDPIIRYLFELEKLYRENERKEAVDNFATKFAYNNKIASRIWLGLIVSGMIVRAVKNKGVVVPDGVRRGFTGWVARQWSRLLPKGSLRARAFEKVLLYKRWQAVTFIGGATAIAGLSEIVDRIQDHLDGERLDPKPLVSILLSEEALRVSQMSCDLRMTLAEKSNEVTSSEFDGYKALYEEMNESFKMVQKLRPRYETTSDAVSAELKTEVDTQESISPELKHLIHKKIQVVHSQCDQSRVNWDVVRANFGMIELRLGEISGRLPKSEESARP
ncbi:MAG: hypothetical protein KDD25_02830 [Bdellovibrionales bacterium]|nr:hypothetical protein [Bdellovibrionales bacterium]